MFGLSAALYFRCTKTGSGGKFCVVLRRGTAWVWEPGYRIFVVEDINHHALRRVRQCSQFLPESITTFNFSTGVLGRSLGSTLTTGRYS